MWPNARISVMGGEQAATVLSSVASDRDPAEIEALRERTRAQYDAQGHPYHATARLWDDGVIDPLTTRDVVGLALSACANAPLGAHQRPVLRM
jgi:3-methylcrotonyl-CoA carboxylase beta subunit